MKKLYECLDKVVDYIHRLFLKMPSEGFVLRHDGNNYRDNACDEAVVPILKEAGPQSTFTFLSLNENSLEAEVYKHFNKRVDKFIDTGDPSLFYGGATGRDVSVSFLGIKEVEELSKYMRRVTYQPFVRNDGKGARRSFKYLTPKEEFLRFVDIMIGQ